MLLAFEQHQKEARQPEKAAMRQPMQGSAALSRGAYDKTYNVARRRVIYYAPV